MQELYRINIINLDNGWDNCTAYYVKSKEIFEEFSSVHVQAPEDWFELLEENETILPKFPFIILGDTKVVV